MKKIIILFLLSFIFLPDVILANNRIDVTLNKCVDGDTAWFNIDNETIKARFLAIDTPESTNKIEEYGKEASNFTCDLLKKALKIEIEYDDESEQEDKYGRKLVWVFVDNKLLQELIVKNGYAEVKYIYGDYKYLNKLNEALEYAKENQLNIWNDYKKEYNDYIIIIIGCIIILLLFIFSKSYRNKIINKTKSNMKKTFKNTIKNLK